MPDIFKKNNIPATYSHSMYEVIDYRARQNIPMNLDGMPVYDAVNLLEGYVQDGGSRIIQIGNVYFEIPRHIDRWMEDGDYIFSKRIQRTHVRWVVKFTPTLPSSNTIVGIVPTYVGEGMTFDEALEKFKELTHNILKETEPVEETPLMKCVTGALEEEGIDTTPFKAKNRMQELLVEESVKMGHLLVKKNEAYGNSFAVAGKFLEMIYGKKIKKKHYGNMLTVVRIFDKLKRIGSGATDENSWGDIAGYAILMMAKARLEAEEKQQKADRKKERKDKKIKLTKIPSACVNKYCKCKEHTHETETVHPICTEPSIMGTPGGWYSGANKPATHLTTPRD